MRSRSGTGPHETSGAPPRPHRTPCPSFSAPVIAHVIGGDGIPLRLGTALWHFVGYVPRGTGYAPDGACMYCPEGWGSALPKYYNCISPDRTKSVQPMTAAPSEMRTPPVVRGLGDHYGPGMVSAQAQRAMAEIAEIERWNAQKYGPQDVAARARAAERGMIATEDASVQRLSSDLVPMVKLGEAVGLYAEMPDWARPIYSIVATASAAASAYHGYKRNDSIGWALWWGVCGGLFPVVVPAIGAAQGFGKRAKR